MDAFVQGLTDAVDGMLWSYAPIAPLPGAGAWFTLRFRKFQLSALFPSMKLLVRGEYGRLTQRAVAEAAAEARMAVRES